MTVSVRYPYGDRFRVPSVTDPSDCRVASEFRDECDINLILKKYASTGVAPTNSKSPMYGDFSNVPSDLLEAATMVQEAQESFRQLPSAVRKRFANDPFRLVDFCSDPGNYDEAVRLGLVSSPEPPVEAKNASRGSSGTTPASKPPKASSGQENPSSVDD